ncbi:translocation/assembly module TamB domain-containing protein [Aquabacterium sp.]|uniref:translocation/assembly module TamB domain-containing protein n=1 Tax=Aquabacterium sp. TaxID=1872578 RepID=UPI00403778A8
MSVAGKLMRTVLALMAALALLVAAVWALAHNEVFTARVLPLLPGIKVVAPEGALLGDFKAARVDIALPRDGQLSLTEVAWQDLRLRWDSHAAWHIGLDVASLKARRLNMNWVPNPVSTPLTAPTDLSLPLSINARRVTVASAESKLWLEPLQDVDAVVAAQHQVGGRVVHQVKLAHVSWLGWHVQGDASLAVDKQLPLDARLLAQQAQPAQTNKGQGEGGGRIELQAKGPLAALLLKGQLAWQASPPAAAQKLQFDADVTPFATWPMPRLQAAVAGLNLADLVPSLPATRLQGQVTLAPQAAHDLQVRLDVRNEGAGAWDDGRVPLKQVRGRISLPGVRAAKDLAQAGRQGELDLVAVLPSLPGHADGNVSLQGGWGGTRVLKATWSALEPQALHRQAPPLQLQGSLQLKPDWAREGAPGPTGQTGQAGQAAKAAKSDPGDAGTWAHLRAAVLADVKGSYGPSFAAAASSARRASVKVDVPVSLNLDGRYGPGQFDVASLKLQAQGAQADLSDALLKWGASAPQPAWSVKGRLKVEAFDPKVWLPWPSGMDGRNQLTGQVDVALDANWRGQLDLHMAPSWLAGVPLSGQVQWHSPLGRPLMALVLDVNAGGNTLNATADVPWHLDPKGRPKWGDGARWQGAVHAPSIGSLQPLAPLLGARQVSGVIDGEFKGRGVWPALSTDGQLKVNRLQWVGTDGVPMGLASAQASWVIEGLSDDAPLRLQLEVSQWQTAHVLLDQAQWQIAGTLRQHQSTLSADLTHKPSKGGKTMVFHVAGAAQGGWQAKAATWQGQLNGLSLSMGGTKPRDLLAVQPVAISWREGPPGRSLQVGATALNMLGASMHLRGLNWQASPDAADVLGELSLGLDLDPLNLPALLASWQPQAGWGGDLMLSGGITLKHSLRQPWVVDASVARQSGDLSLSEPTIQGSSAQRLGIREARVVLQARDGVWALSQQFDGRVLGVLKGRQVVHARNPTDLPSGSDPLSGELDLQIANLRPWGTWVPAGWRLTGQMRAKAEVGGTLGAPQYRGQVRGQNLGLGQALLGVNFTDGQLQMDLEGEHIRLTQLVAQAGAQGGRVSVEGDATLGAEPKARLSLKADRFALLQRVDRRVMVSGDVQAALGAENIDVDGRLQVDEGLIDITRSDAPTVGDDVNVLNRPGQDPEEQAEASSATTAPKRKLNANVSVDLGHKLRLKGKGLDAFLAGKLRVSTPGNRPAVNGTVHVENGTFAAYGQKLVIEKGDIAFTGPVENPRLDILAMRPQSPAASASDVKVGVNITGTAQDPRVRLYSDPAMSETEKLSWLVLGRAPTGLGGADIGLLQSAAVALLSGEGSSPSDNLVAMLGLDELTVRQSESAGAVRDTVVNLGKQVSKYWYVGYERNLNATSGNWQLIYRLAQRVTVRAQAGDDNAVDFIWSWRWD